VAALSTTQVKNMYFIFRKLALQIYSANIVMSLSKGLLEYC